LSLVTQGAAQIAQNLASGHSILLYIKVKK
jgi:hypothetical protein